MGHDFLGNGEKIDAYLFGYALSIYLVFSEVRLELVYVMQQC